MGEDFIKLFFWYFKPIQQDACLFRVLGGKPVQQQPVVLKDAVTAQKIASVAGDLKNMLALLGNKAAHNISFFREELKVVHESIRRKLLDARKNILQATLASHLYELLPDNRNLRAYFPSI